MRKFPARLLRSSATASTVIVLGLFLSACSGNGYRAPVVDRSTAVDNSGPIVFDSRTNSGVVSGIPSRTNANVVSRRVASGSINTRNNSKANIHKVSSGETLHSIAWLHGVDYRRIAIINGLRAPFTIYPGQELKLNVDSVSAEDIRRAGYRGNNTTASSRSSATNATSSRQGLLRRPISAEQNNIIKWRWPSNGKLLGSYGNGGLQGIDIAGRVGEPVLAASDGEVVYAGRGIQGAGNLIIIRHNDRILSAYAHNSAMLVSEGVKIKAGDRIADVGSDSDGRELLHFEIRLAGKPVDPLQYLPSR